MAELKGDEKIVVMSDIHGYDNPLAQAIDFYGDQPDRYLVIGDMIGGDGPHSAQVLDRLQQVDADVTLGNWELYLLAGMLHQDEYTRHGIQYSMRPFEQNYLGVIAGSYGVATKGIERSEAIKRLREKMQQRGHLQMLAQAALYFEGRDFVAIHAGLTDQAWLPQKQTLYGSRQKITSGEFDEPQQIIDLGLARQAEAFGATHKTVVTGHSHSPRGSRISANGARVRIGSQLDLGRPLYAWQSWNGELKEIPQK